MTSWTSVRASHLHDRRLVHDETLIRRATLFPFFDRLGSVSQVLIVAAGSSELRTFRADTTRAWIPFWGPIRITDPIVALDEALTDQLAGLWHYDPWWLLKDAVFHGQAAATILQSTNCADAFDRQPADLVFSSCLTNLRTVRVPQSTQECESKRFQPEMLPAREPTPCSGTQTRGTGWQLDPIW